jgi:hypothetical protein
MTHTNILKSVRVLVAQPDPKKKHKTHGHQIAELVFDAKGPAGEHKREYTYVDPTNDNNLLWEAVIEKFVAHRPCLVALEYPNGIRYKNSKTGLIDADVKGVAPRVLDIYDAKTLKSVMPKANPFNNLFDTSK